MSAHRVAWVDCDHVGPDGHCEVSSLYIPDATPTTIARARAEATRRGWVRRGGRDYCPDHTPERPQP